MRVFRLGNLCAGLLGGWLAWSSCGALATCGALANCGAAADDGSDGIVLVAPGSVSDEYVSAGPAPGAPEAGGSNTEFGESVALDENTGSSFVSASGDLVDEACDECERIGNWLENTELFMFGDQYRNVGDTNYLGILNTSVGARGGFNSGFALGDWTSARLQLGMSLGLYDPKGRMNSPDTGLERQFITTLGFYRRSDVANGRRFVWGAVYDVFSAQNWGNFSQDITLGQIRLIGGWALSDTREVGLWGTIGTQETYAWTATVFVLPGQHLRATDQLNVYYKKHWAFGADTQLYAGVINADDYGDWQIGFNGRAPMNDRASLYAGANYVAPSDPMGILGSTEEQWNFSVGMVLFLGRKAAAPDVSGHQGLPLLPVADNGSFLLTPRK